MQEVVRLAGDRARWRAFIHSGARFRREKKGGGGRGRRRRRGGLGVLGREPTQAPPDPAEVAAQAAARLADPTMELRIGSEFYTVNGHRGLGNIDENGFIRSCAPNGPLAGHFHGVWYQGVLQPCIFD